MISSLLAVSVFAQVPPDDRSLAWVPDINGRSIHLVKPAFPDTAVVTGADGDTIGLKVIVDESGNVISAQCSLSCHPFLKDAAELAAMTSKFKPLLVKGRAVRYEGTLLYSFVVNRVNWFGFGTALESTRQFDNISFGPVAQILASEFNTEKERLLALDADGGVDYDARQKGIAEVESSIKSKLKGTDLWHFELGMAIRRVTFWSMAGRIDRREMQKSLEELAPFVASAPEGISKQLTEDLQAFSKFRIPTDMSDRDLIHAIYDMSRKIPHDPK